MFRHYDCKFKDTDEMHHNVVMRMRSCCAWKRDKWCDCEF